MTRAVEALREAERFMAYFAGETGGSFVGPGTPQSCLAQIRSALTCDDAQGSVEIRQHIGWLKQYLAGMTEHNWRDMRMLAGRQLDALAAAQPPAAPVETMEDIVQRVKEACAQVADRAAEMSGGNDSRGAQAEEIAISIRALIPAPPRSSAATVDAAQMLELADQIDYCPDNRAEECLPFLFDKKQRELLATALRIAAQPQRVQVPRPACDCEPPLGSLCARCAYEAKHCIHGISLTTPCVTCETDYGEERAYLVSRPHRVSESAPDASAPVQRPRE